MVAVGGDGGSAEREHDEKAMQEGEKICAIDCSDKRFRVLPRDATRRRLTHGGLSLISFCQAKSTCVQSILFWFSA